MAIPSWVDTVDATSAAILGISAVKGNPAKNPLSLLAANLTSLKTVATTLRTNSIPG